MGHYISGSLFVARMPPIRFLSPATPIIPAVDSTFRSPHLRNASPSRVPRLGVVEMTRAVSIYKVTAWKRLLKGRLGGRLGTAKVPCHVQGEWVSVGQSRGFITPWEPCVNTMNDIHKYHRGTHQEPTAKISDRVNLLARPGDPGLTGALVSRQGARGQEISHILPTAVAFPLFGR